MKTWMKSFPAAMLMLLALFVLPVQAEELSGVGWSYSGTVLTITQNIANYGLASSSSPWMIGTPFEKAGIDHTVTEIVVAEGVTSIGDLAFYGMNNLTHVTLPSTLQRIGSDTFMRCSHLAEVTIPASVTSIGHGAFYGCSGLKRISFEGAPPSISTYDAFYDFNNTNTFVFSGCTADVYYKPYPYWTDSKMAAFSKKCYPTWHPLCDAYGTCGDNAQWYLIDGDQLVIRGSGDMTDYSWGESPWKSYRNRISSVSVGAGITRIGSYAFSGGGATDCLVSVSLPTTVTSIGYYAFDHCAALQSISLPDSITRIEHDAFYGCYNLISVDLPKNLETIGSSAFGSCYALQSLEMPDTVVELGNYALANTEALQTIRLSAGIKTLSDGVLANTGLETLEIPQGIENIASSVFSGSAHLRSVRIPLSVQTIATNAFNGLSETLVLTCHADSYAAQFAVEQGIAVQTEPHVETILPAKEATCTEAGITEGVQCSLCGITLVEQTVIPAVGHSYDQPVFVWEEDSSACTVSFTCMACGDEQNPEPIISAKQVKEPDCVNPGETEYIAAVEFGFEEIQNPENPDETIIVPCVFEGKLRLADISALGHKEVVLPGIEPTCTEPGMKDYIFCEVCGEEFQTADELLPLGHTESVTVEALAPTCTEAGHTQQIGCTVCGVVLTASTPIEPMGHKEEVTAEAIVPECEKTGMTPQISCSVCKQVLAAAQVVPALGHTQVVDAAVAPACESTGLTEGSHCSVCGKTLTAQTVLPAVGHKPEVDAAIPPTDREPGLTEGSHCSVCGKTLTAQSVVPANFTWEGNTVIAYNGNAKDVIIPDDVTALGNTLFKDNTEIRTVRVSDRVKSLGTQSFFGCTALTDVWLPRNLTSIGAQTFYNVKARIHADADSSTAVSLSYRGVPFTIDNGMILRYRVTSSMGQPTAVWLVAYESDMNSIILPESICGVPLTKLQSGALSACSNMRDIWISESVTSIAADAFKGHVDTLLIRSSVHAYARAWAADNGFAWEHDSHSQDILKAVKPSCTESGLTEGLWCAECGKVFTSQTIIDPLGHVEVTDEASAPTCTEDGMTEGKHCFVCDEILTAQKVIPALGHRENMIPAKAPTCTEAGNSAYYTCDSCGKFFVADGESFTEVEKDSWVITKLRYHRMQDDACIMCGERFDFTSMDVLTLPTDLKQIKEEAFCGNTAQVIVVPEGCRSIGLNAFADCAELCYAILPEALTQNAEAIFGENVPILIVVCGEDAN